MSISIHSKVQVIIDAIVEGEIDPVVEPGNGKIYVLDVSNRELGSIMYTVFDEESRYPEESASVKYGAQHIIYQVLFSSMNRYVLPNILTEDIPGYTRPILDPLIIPSLTGVYPTKIGPNPDTSITNGKGKSFLK